MTGPARGQMVAQPTAAQPMAAQPMAAHRVETIGSVAGLVWNYLHEHGPVTLSKLAREIDAPRDMVMQGVGWLAREEKVTFHPGVRSKLIALR